MTFPQRKVFIPVLITTTICAGLIISLHNASKDVIQKNKQQHILKATNGMFTVEYDNPVYDDYIEINNPALSGDGSITRVYRARKDGTGMGVLYMPVVTKGYNGPVSLAISISRDGHIMSARVIKQNESRGLGAEIDQNNSDWITQFYGLSLKDVPSQYWRFESERGKFDVISGATITSRAVTDAIRETLEHYYKNNDILYKVETERDPL